MMSASNEFVQKIEEFKRPTREMLVALGDPGCKPITKISGVPWWPAGIKRPTCSKEPSYVFHRAVSPIRRSWFRVSY